MNEKLANISPIQKLDSYHYVDAFDCGKEPLNRFLRRFALENQRSDNAQTYVVCHGENRVIGYYSLTAAMTDHLNAPPRISKGQPRHPLPLILLARLAVDHTEQSQGMGQALLKDALTRTKQVADIAGVRALLVHAKDDEALVWYRKFGFQPSPINPYHLYLLMKDLRILLRN